MFTSIKITSGWPVENTTLSVLRDKTAIKFTRGVNCLIGRNASGKSTLLKLLGHEVGCPYYGGWNQSDTREPFHEFDKVERVVEHDGADVFLHMADKSDEPMVAMGMPHDSLSSSEQVSLMLAKLSTGQGRAIRLDRVLRALKRRVPHPASAPAKQSRVNRLKSNQPGPSAVLLDEPERSLDMDAQVLFWTEIIPKVAKVYQVIVATHSPLALFMPDVNVVDLTSGYAADVRAALTRLVAATASSKTNPEGA
jgi:predicted ATPase